MSSFKPIHFPEDKIYDFSDPSWAHEFPVDLGQLELNIGRKKDGTAFRLITSYDIQKYIRSLLHEGIPPRREPTDEERVQDQERLDQNIATLPKGIRSFMDQYNAQHREGYGNMRSSTTIRELTIDTLPKEYVGPVEEVLRNKEREEFYSSLNFQSQLAHEQYYNKYYFNELTLDQLLEVDAESVEYYGDGSTELPEYLYGIRFGTNVYCDYLGVDDIRTYEDDLFVDLVRFYESLVENPVGVELKNKELDGNDGICKTRFIGMLKHQPDIELMLDLETDVDCFFELDGAHPTPIMYMKFQVRDKQHMKYDADGGYGSFVDGAIGRINTDFSYLQFKPKALEDFSNYDHLRLAQKFTEHDLADSYLRDVLTPLVTEVILKHTNDVVMVKNFGSEVPNNYLDNF